VISLILRINKLKIKYGKLIYPTGYKRVQNDIEKFAAKLREEVIKLK
jgi:hypothetical protein